MNSPFSQPKQNCLEQNKHVPNLSTHLASEQKCSHWQLLEPTIGQRQTKPQKNLSFEICIYQ
jgi:hypothetical protein